MEKIYINKYAIEVKCYIYHGKWYRTHQMGKQNNNKINKSLVWKFSVSQKKFFKMKDVRYQWDIYGICLPRILMHILMLTKRSGVLRIYCIIPHLNRFYVLTWFVYGELFEKYICDQLPKHIQWNLSLVLKISRPFYAFNIFPF